MNRNLDSCYFRVKRNNKYVDVCFSDLTADEREIICLNRSAEWFQSLAYHLADQLKFIGEELDLTMG